MEVVVYTQVVRCAVLDLNATLMRICEFESCSTVRSKEQVNEGVRFSQIRIV